MLARGCRLNSTGKARLAFSAAPRRAGRYKFLILGMTGFACLSFK